MMLFLFSSIVLEEFGDMSSVSFLFCRHYVNLQKIYQAKAEADFLVMEQRVRNHLKKIGRETNMISKQTIRSFCRNARKLKVSSFLHDIIHA